MTPVQRKKALLAQGQASKMAKQLSKDRKSNDNAYVTALSALKNDLKALSEIKEIREKIEFKKQLIPRYKNYVDDYVSSGKRHINEIFVYYIVWLIDVEQYEEAWRLALVAVERGQVMPDRFKRDLPEFVTESLADGALEITKANEEAIFILDVAKHVKSGEWSIQNEIVLSKLYRTAALQSEMLDDYQSAVHWFEACMNANPEKHGVKSRYKQAKKILEATPPGKEHA